MKRIIRALFFSVCIFFCENIVACCEPNNCEDNCSACDASCNVCTSARNGNPFFSIRSQSWNAARKLVGWQSLIHRFDQEKMYAVFSVTPEYGRSFQPCHITNYFFGNDLQNGRITISGSRKGSTDAIGTGAVARTEHEWLADYFGLPPDFVSTVGFNPCVKTWLVDFNLFIGLDEVVEGLFFKISAPIVQTKHSLNISEKVKTTGSLPFEMGYMSEEEITRDKLPEDFKDAMRGVSRWGDMEEPLKYGRIDCCEMEKSRIADIHIALGWDFLKDENYRLGVMLHAGFPAGGKPDARYLFEPVIGNGGHYELGTGLSGFVNISTNEDETRSFSIYCDILMAHLFTRKQMRSFDLDGKPNSRYMLISELGTPVENIYGGRDTYFQNPPAVAQYQAKLFPLINKSTCCTNVSVGLQGEIAIKAAFTYKNFSFDIGYNLWGKTGEKLCSGCSLEENTYALKGDAFVVGWAAANGTPTANTVRRLSATQRLADIHSGMNTPIGTAFDGTPGANHDARNNNVDNAQLAWSQPDGTTLTNNIQYIKTGANADANYTTHTSIQPDFLKSSDFNTWKTPRALSHKVFAHLNYAWENNQKEKETIPLIGIGGEAEFSGESNGCYNALSQWGVWVKGGLSF